MAKTKKTYTYTSPLSEYAIEYRRVPVILVIDFTNGWKLEHPAPPIPKSMVDIGGEKREIENPTDPDYQKALTEYEGKANEAARRFLWRKAIVLSDENRRDVAELREEIKNDPEGAKLVESDEQVYAQNIVCLNVDELMALQNLIYSISQPTPEAVENSKAAFRG